MTFLSRLTWTLLAVAFAAMSASIFLIHQYKLGIPYPFATNVTMATLVGLIAPLVAVIVYSMLVKESPARHKFWVFCGVCASLAIIISVITF